MSNCLIVYLSNFPAFAYQGWSIGVIIDQVVVLQFGLAKAFRANLSCTVIADQRSFDGNSGSSTNADAATPIPACDDSQNRGAKHVVMRIDTV